MQIPRFQAQIGQVQVPTMKDYQYEQNRSIYQALKAAGERINNTFFEIMAEGSLAQPNQQQQNSTFYERKKEMIRYSNIDNEKS